MNGTKNEVILMKHCLALVIATILLPLCPAEAKIPWMTNYEEAVTKSKSSSKPLLMFFTGSDWCGWCN
ncbi:MAG: thioredoxin family protein [Parachlamydia sp.]|nr:thioredoxin family protein [Parachlamydia sp.]